MRKIVKKIVVKFLDRIGTLNVANRVRAYIAVYRGLLSTKTRRNRKVFYDAEPEIMATSASVGPRLFCR